MTEIYENRKFRDYWLEYRSEFLFAILLSILTVFSYWQAAFIPEEIFEHYINPIQYIATIVLCFYGGWMMFRHHEGNRLRRAWARMLIVWGCIDVLMVVFRYFYHVMAIGGTPDDPLYNTSLVVGNILAWLLFVYPSQVLRPGWLRWHRALLQILPMIVLGVVDYYWDANLMPLIMLYPAAIFIAVCSHISKYRRWCEDNFSSMDQIDVQWIIRYLTMLFLLGLSFYFISFWYVPNRMLTQQWLLFLILAYGTEQILFRPDPWENMQAEDSQSFPPMDEDARSENVRRIEQWMTTEKPYLNPDFQLRDMRKVVSQNRSYISHLINTEYGCSFYNYVNKYRIEEAKQVIAEHPDMKLAEIASRCGFSSPSTFSRAFARETGVAPREWSTRPQS